VSILFKKIEASFPPQCTFRPRKDLWVYSYRFPEVFEPDEIGRSSQEIEFRAKAGQDEAENVSRLEIEFKLSRKNFQFLLKRMGSLCDELGGAVKHLTYYTYKNWLEGEKPFWLKDLAARSGFMVSGKTLEGEGLGPAGLAKDMEGEEGSYYSGILELSFSAIPESGALNYSRPASGKAARPKKVVMLVDDNEATLSLLQTILRTEFLEEELDFVPCNSGIKAFELAMNTKPDMILLDLMMPGKSGFEVLDDLKKNPQTRDIPVVILSVIYNEESVSKAEKLGVERYLVKPFVPYDISQVIRELLFGEKAAD
jgi:CheY-like chemotaxis protein